MHLIRQADALERGQEPEIVDMYDKMAFLEFLEPDGKTGVDLFHTLTPPRVVKTHLPHVLWTEHLKKHPELKVIQTLRNPKDALVSYYHHFMADLSMGGFNGTWDQFFEIVKAKMLPWGDLFEYQAEWYRFNKDRPNSLVLRYEDTKKDTKGEIAKIAKCMGFSLTEKAIELVIEHSSLEKVAPKMNAIEEEDPDWRIDKSLFIRKGKVGGWRNYFSSEQSEWVEARMREVWEPLGITYTYE